MLKCNNNLGLEMIKIAIVYHSGYGHTEVIAKAISRGVATEANAQPTLIKISPEGTITEAEWQILEAAEGIIFGAPTYMGCVSGPFKMFADASSKPWASKKWQNKIAAGFTNSGGYSGDKLSSLSYLAVLAGQHGMIWVSNDIRSAGKNPEDLNRLASYLGMMSQSDNAVPDVTPPSGDIKTAEMFGQRVAVATIRWHK